MRDWLALCCVVAVGLALAYFADRATRRDFDAMTPAEHLEASRAALKEGLSDTSERHASAITAGAPEFLDARKIKEQLGAAKKAARQRVEDARQAAQLADESRRTAVHDLQAGLRSLGYDLTVSQSDEPGEIVITSREFDDTDHRVRFLSLLRGRDSPTAGVCLAGFSGVRLKGPGLIFRFSETYSLRCFEWP
jgi:ABC-type protease/lipase transport system fused ATPase/permease subunit